MFGQNMGFSNWLCGAGDYMPGPFGMIFNVILWVGIIFLVVKVFQYLFSLKERTILVSPLDTLKKRYAAGEITKDDFEQMKKDIA